MRGKADQLVTIRRHGPLAASWLGHATVLLRQGGTTVLTDPVFSHRIGLKVGPIVFGPHRLAPTPVEPTSLPPIDVVLISHAHFDHLDRPSLAAIAGQGTTVVTSRGTRRLIPPGFGQVLEMDWDQTVRVGELEVTAVEPEHWGARTGVDRGRGFNAYLLRSGSVSTFYAGDTASTDAFDRIRGADLAIFGVGAYDPWEHKHATPEQVCEMFNRMQAKYLLPVHHSTFELSDEPPEEPMARLLKAAGERAGRVIQMDPGRLWTPDGG